MKCRARYLVPRGPVFQVEPGSIGAIGKLVGAQDVTLGGDRAFDQSFIVGTDERSAVQRVWSAQAMRLMFRALRDSRVRSNGREIELARSVIHSPAVMNAMIDSVGWLASADYSVSRRCARCPAPRITRPRGRGTSGRHPAWSSTSRRRSR